MSIATSLTSQGYLTLFGTTLTAPSVNMESGSLVGGGTIDGSLINSGYLHPTNAETLTVTNYTQTANGELSVQWGSSGLAVNSNAALSGSLVVGIYPKRPPKKGSTYTAMTFGSLSGGFKTVTVEEGGTVEYTGNSVVVTFQ